MKKCGIIQSIYGGFRMEEENKRHHLSMIQDIISRMGNNSLSLKEWTITLVVSIYAFVGTDSQKAVIITMMLIMIFWLLDAYYLMQERMFRALYDKVRKQREEDIDFDMNFNSISINLLASKKYCFINALLSKTVASFYVGCVITAIVIYFIRF